MGEALATNARRIRDKTALIFGERRLTYGELDARVNRAARLLQQLGIRKGDHVAIGLPNGLEIVELLFACARLGAVAMPLNLRLSPEEMAYMLSDSDSLGLISFDPLLQQAAAAGLLGAGSFRFVLCVGEGPEGIPSYEALRDAMDSSPPEVQVRDEDPWILVYTSGTTGRPKGALRSQRSNLMIALLLAAEIGISTDDVGLAFLPLFHVNSIWLVSLSLCIGTTCAIYSHRTFHPGHVIEEIRQHNVTYSMFVPSMLTFLADAAERGQLPPDQWRVLMTSSAPLTTALRDRVLRQFPSVRLYDVYGATELGAVTSIRHQEGGVIGSIGMPALAQDVKILDEAGNELPTGEVGELYCAGPTLMDCYYKDPKATAKAFVGEYLSVGDLAYRDERGYLYLVDRKSDMIITSGENVYPAEVEGALARHPDVALSAVVGLPDERRGEAVVAVVVPHEGRSIDVADLQSICNESLADFKRPRQYLVWTELPMGVSGKVLRREVRRRLKEAGEDSVNS